MKELRFDCPQGCGAKLVVTPPKVEKWVSRESMWGMERMLGQSVIGAVMFHAIFECEKVPEEAPQ